MHAHNLTKGNEKRNLKETRAQKQRERERERKRSCANTYGYVRTYMRWAHLRGLGIDLRGLCMGNAIIEAK